MAEARITRDRISDPIVKGDEIYTPLWSPGRKEKFAFVGLFDLDNDGINDRDVLHDLVAASGGEIVDEVDDKGVRHPTGGQHQRRHQIPRRRQDSRRVRSQARG